MSQRRSFFSTLPDTSATEDSSSGFDSTPLRSSDTSNMSISDADMGDRSFDIPSLPSKQNALPRANDIQSSMLNRARHDSNPSSKEMPSNNAPQANNASKAAGPLNISKLMKPANKIAQMSKSKPPMNNHSREVKGPHSPSISRNADPRSRGQDPSSTGSHIILQNPSATRESPREAFPQTVPRTEALEPSTPRRMRLQKTSLTVPVTDSNVNVVEPGDRRSSEIRSLSPLVVVPESAQIQGQDRSRRRGTVRNPVDPDTDIQEIFTNQTGAQNNYLGQPTFGSHLTSAQNINPQNQGQRRQREDEGSPEIDELMNAASSRMTKRTKIEHEDTNRPERQTSYLEAQYTGHDAIHFRDIRESSMSDVGVSSAQLPSLGAHQDMQQPQTQQGSAHFAEDQPAPQDKARIEALRARWENCTIEEWYEGGKEILGEFEGLVNLVRDAMSSKMQAYSKLHNRVDQQSKVLDSRDGRLQKEKGRLAADAANVLK